MKKFIMLTTITAFLLLFFSGCSFFLNEEEKSLVGFWSGDTWTMDSEDTCYYDFRSDGSVFITEWTEDLQSTNNFIVPNDFQYSFDGEYLTLQQFFGIVKIEFHLVQDTSSVELAYYMTVNSVSDTIDYTQLFEGNILYMEMKRDYEDAALSSRKQQEVLK